MRAWLCIVIYLILGYLSWLAIDKRNTIDGRYDACKTEDELESTKNKYFITGLLVGPICFVYGFVAFVFIFIKNLFCRR